MDRTRKRDGRTDGWTDGLTDGRTVRLLYASQSSFGGIKIDNCREVAEVTARFYKGCNKVAARSVIGSRTKSVMASLLSIHKRLAATDFDRGPIANGF